MNHHERKFSQEIKTSIAALGREADQHCFDDVGIQLQGPKRPGDRESTYNGSHFLLELKAVEGKTLPYSQIKLHQVRSLMRKQDAGGFGLVLVKQVGNPPKAWAIPCSTLIDHDLHLGVRGSFKLPSPGVTPIGKIPHPQGWKGRVWDLRTLFDGLIAERRAA